MLGDGTTTSRSTPVQVINLTGISAIDGGGRHTVALKSDGTIWAWGWNNCYQLGNGTTTYTSNPMQVNFPAVSNDGLMGYYPFNGNAYDESGNGNHGTVNGATLTTDRFGSENKAYSFNGAGDYINVNSNDTLDITDNLTLSVWVKMNAFNNIGGIICYGANRSWNYETYSLNTYSSPDHLSFKGNWPDTWYDSGTLTTLKLQTWYHIAATFQSGTARIFLNGVPERTEQWGVVKLPLSDNRVLRFGENQPGGSEFFSGAIDDIRIYNRVLPDSEIQGLYNSGSEQPATNPPMVTTGTAEAITAASATLNGTVNPNGAGTTYYFQYGTTTGYGSKTTEQSTGSGTGAASVTANLTGLSMNTTYHFRLVATNSAGTTNGSDQMLKTASSDSPGQNPPDGVSVVDATANSASAPVYMGDVVTGGSQMELSVNFPAYNKPVDIWILIALPDGRFYTANESGKFLSYSSGSLAAIASGVSGTKTEKTIISPFAIGAANTAFEPWPVEGTWTAYWLVAPDSNGDILQAIENGDYELGSYSFKVMSQSDVVSSDLTITDYFPQSGPAGSHVFLKLTKNIADINGTLSVFYNQKAVDANTITTKENIIQFILPQDTQSGDIQLKAGTAVGNTVKFSVLSSVITPLVSQSVSPSSVDQTVSYKDEIVVTIPPGVLDKTRTVSISTVENCPPNSFIPFGSTAIDVTIDGLEQLNDFIDINVKYDPSRLRPEYSAEDQLMVMRWDDKGKYWIPLPYSVDEKNQIVHIKTDHLCPLLGIVILGAPLADIASTIFITGLVAGNTYSWTGVGEELMNDIYPTSEGNFRLMYSKSKIMADKKLNNKTWIGETYVKPPYSMKYNQMVDTNTKEIMYPYFIQDMGNLLETALKTYVDVCEFKNPTDGWLWGKNPIIAKFDSRWLNTSYTKGNSNYILGNIHYPTGTLSFNGFKAGSKSYGIIAHELFHRIQDSYYNIVEFKFGSHFWWIEAAADYAGYRIAWSDKMQLNSHENTGADFFSYPLSTTGEIPGWNNDDQEYQYAAAGFIQFLVERKGLNFKDMIKHVASGSPLYTPLEMLNGYKNINLSEYYRQFAAWGIFCSDSFLERHPITKIANKTETLLVPENASIEISFTGGENSSIDIYKSDGKEYQKDNNTPGPDGTTTNQKSTTINVNKGDFLYLVATNTGKNDETLNVRIKVIQNGEEKSERQDTLELKGGYSGKLLIYKTEETKCAFQEYMQFGGSKSSFNVQYMDCWKKYQPMTFPLCFKLNPGGSISPTQSECYQGGNPFVQEYLTGSWSCNAINISFKTTMNGFIDDPGIACHLGCMAVTAALSGTATITADKDGNLSNTATGDVTQSYSWDHACCPTTKPPESDVCGGSF